MLSWCLHEIPSATTDSYCELAVKSEYIVLTVSKKIVEGIHF